MKLYEKNLQEVLQRLAAVALLLTPQTIDGITKFAPYQMEGELALATNTLLPPKDALFPQTEKLYAYSESGGELALDEQKQQRRQIIFGVRPCDVYSVGCLDKVFLEGGYADSLYARKRNALTIIALACTQPAATCFCDSMGIDPNQAPQADVELRPLAGGWQVLTHSAAGEEVLQIWYDLLKPIEDGEFPVANCSCALRVDTAGLAEKLPALIEHTLWQELARPCLSCGVCAYLCPTCHCFDIGVDSRGRQGAQFRCWDSCMFAEYTLMAGGYNPRATAAERLANRFLHKLAYFPRRHGQTLCTGCGRCLAKCPVHINITELITAAREVNA